MTNKDLLNTIAKKQLENAVQLSDFINKQEGINERLLGYLENNHKTNQVGVVQKQQELNDRVSSLETNKKVMIGIAAIFISITTWFGGFFK